MPMMNDLLEKLQDDPPSTEQELMAVLSETGYDLTMKEPSMADEEEEEGEMEMMGEEEEEEEEEEEDMGPMDEPEGGAMEMEIIKEMMPMGGIMAGAPEGANPRMMMQARTRKAAKKALKEG